MKGATDDANKEENVAENHEKLKDVSGEVIKRKDVKKPINTYVLELLYPQRQKGANDEFEFAKLTKILRNLHFNIPFINTIL